jgi:hypothetical protein
MPLCVYLCYTPGCNTKMDRWMPTADEGAAAAFECPRCGVVMQCAWTGSQMKTPNMKDAAEFAPLTRRGARHTAARAMRHDSREGPADSRASCRAARRRSMTRDRACGRLRR